MKKSAILIIIGKIILTLICIAAAIFMLGMSAFFFDAPGSDKNWVNYWNVVFVTGFPLSFIPVIWIKRFWWIPLVVGLLMISGFVALEYFCNGVFACNKSN